MRNWLATEGANPVIPIQWEFIVLGIGALALILFIGALIDIARSHHLTGVAQAVWVLVVLAFPMIGSLVWFLIGRKGNTFTSEADTNGRQRNSNR